MIRLRSLHQRSTRYAVLATLALRIVSHAHAVGAAEPLRDAAQIEVDAAQRVTVAGEFDSLKKLLDELCREADVELRSYDADDRPVRMEYHALPLVTVLAGLLRQESYIVGVSPGEAGLGPHVVWLRVTGGPPGTPVAPSDETPSPTPFAFEVPSTFGEATFATEDPEQRARALEGIAKRLLASSNAGGGLLAAKPEVIANLLRDYPHAGALVRQLRDEQADPAIKSKLNAILSALE